MIAVASGLFLYLAATGTIPPQDAFLTSAVWVVLFLSAALALAAMAARVERVVARLGQGIGRWIFRRKARQSFRNYIPFLSEEERKILGYLLAKKQKTFLADHDGGYAATLLARNIVRYVGAPGQSFSIDRCPMVVPDEVWSVMEERPEDFPYKPEYSDDRYRVETEPWRIPWMAR